jgi:hypothetical protein
MYVIRGADQQEYGPVSAEVLRQWIAERRADSRTLVRETSASEWKTLGSMPEFSRLQPQFEALPAARSESQGLAVASLVLGILGVLCLGPITGIPALILGIFVLSRSRGQPGRDDGTGFAVAGIALGVASFIFILIMAGMLLPAVAKAKDKARSIHCLNNLKQIGLATAIYSNDHAGALVDDLTELQEVGFDPVILWCPSDSAKSPALSWDDLTVSNISYSWQGSGLRDDRYPNFILSHCPIHGHVLQADGAVRSASSR